MRLVIPRWFFGESAANKRVQSDTRVGYRMEYHGQRARLTR